jgi:hypothetical protein
MALLVRDDEGVRAEDERWLTATVARAMTPRPPAEAERALGQALEQWGRGRGDWMTAGIAMRPSPGGWVRTPASPALTSPATQRTETPASSALRGLVELSGRAAFRHLLSSALDVRPPVIGPVDVPGAEAGALASFPPGRSAAVRGRRPPAGVAWAVRDGHLLAGAGPDPVPLLASLTSPPVLLGSDPQAVRALAALADSATFTLFAQPLRLDPVHDGHDGSPLVLAWGKKGGDLWARVDLSDALVTELVRLRGALF